MDVEEGVWVAGVSLSWRGRLTSAEARALRSSVQSGPAGSVDHPIALSEETEIVQRMLQQVRCALPSGLEGTVALRQPDDARLASISTELRQRLVLEPGFVLADGDDVDWQMGIEVSEEDTQRLVLTLAPGDRPATRQQLASLVTRVPSSVALPSRPAPVPSSPMRSENLLSELDLDSSASCSTGRGDCVEVGFAIDRAAHVLVFRTHAAGVAPTSCSARQELKPAGDLRYRVKLPAAGTDRAGIYVVASEQREPIRRLRKIVQAATSRCGAKHLTGGEWRADLIRAAVELEGRLEWRVVHLSIDPADRNIRRI